MFYHFVHLPYYFLLMSIFIFSIIFWNENPLVFKKKFSRLNFWIKTFFLKKETEESRPEFPVFETLLCFLLCFINCEHAATTQRAPIFFLTVSLLLPILFTSRFSPIDFFRILFLNLHLVAILQKSKRKDYLSKILNKYRQL